MVELLTFMVEKFIAHNDKLKITETEKGNEIVLTAFLDPEDMGKVIGRQGRIAKAIRTIIKAASAKDGKKYSVEIAEVKE